jgi:hypothetical protein
MGSVFNPSCCYCSAKPSFTFSSTACPLTVWFYSSAPTPHHHLAISSLAPQTTHRSLALLRQRHRFVRAYFTLWRIRWQFSSPPNLAQDVQFSAPPPPYLPPFLSRISVKHLFQRFGGALLRPSRLELQPRFG